ncbi:MAG: hypothetical protein ABI775_00690 [Pseudonocardiales bacterium]|nr:hypothetical protein [Actinomycetota bacterium]
MSTHLPDDAATPDSLGSPDETRGGPTFDEAVDNAEAGSQVEGVHTPSGEARPGESRVEQMPDVEGVTEGHVVGDKHAPSDTPKPGPAPGGIGSGGAQRVEGARISDRISAGEAVPDGPPFDPDSGENPEDTSGASS